MFDYNLDSTQPKIALWCHKLRRRDGVLEPADEDFLLLGVGVDVQVTGFGPVETTQELPDAVLGA